MCLSTLLSCCSTTDVNGRDRMRSRNRTNQERVDPALLVQSRGEHILSAISSTATGDVVMCAAA